MCLISTTAGYSNLSKDFNCFVVGDATLATYPANDSPAYATNAAISFASLQQLITECEWIKILLAPAPARDGNDDVDPLGQSSRGATGRAAL